MNRRQFFKSGALWLAGLIVSPHIELLQEDYDIIRYLSELEYYIKHQWQPRLSDWAIVVHPDLLDEMMELWPTAFENCTITELQHGEPVE